MTRWRFIVPLFGVGLGILTVAPTPNANSTDATTKGVAEHYTGSWVCQTFMPGYDVRPPGADPSQPLTNRLTTPSTVAVVKFSLRADGTYEAPNAKGHYSLDPVTKAITWLDGPHQKTLTKTQAETRENGAPKLGFVMNRRYYGCFMPERRGRDR